MHSSRGGIRSGTPSAGHPLAQRAVGRDAAADREPVEAGLLERALDPQRERLDDRPLVGRGEVGAALGRPLLAEVADLVEQRGLQAGEGEVQAGDAARDREGEGVRVALLRQPLERRAAGVRQAEQPRALVEGLAGGVVERRAEDREAVVVLDAREERVAAAGDQAQERRLERLGGEEVRRDVALEVVDRRERQAARARRSPSPSRRRRAARRRALGPA